MAPVAWVASHGSQSQRDRAGLLLSRLLLSSPTRVGRLHGDPHPGNFRLLDDDRLAVLDFGSSLPMHGWSPNLVALLRAGRDRDPLTLFQLASEAHLLRGTDIRPEDLLELVDPLLQPLRQETFLFSPPWLRALTTRMSDPRSTAARIQRKLNAPVRTLLIQRVAAGTTGVLCSLQARVPLRQEAETWLPGLTASQGA